MFKKLTEKALYTKAKGLRERQSYDKLMMLTILVLQRYYKLSN